LKPETSTALNVGSSFKLGGFDFDIDYWQFNFEDVLTRENLQQVVNADPSDTARIIRTSAGTIAIVNTRFVNANEIDTAGLDLNVRNRYETDIGTFMPSFSSTYVLKYDVTSADGQTIDGLGKMNRTNTGNPAPELRANLGLAWSMENQSASLFYRYVSAYDRNESSNTDKIDAFGQVDLQYSYMLEDAFAKDTSASITLGLINAFDEEPPFVAISGSYDPRTGDPRGRRAYLSLQLAF
jgi:iron complex outermembrane receptor protein